MSNWWFELGLPDSSVKLLTTASCWLSWWAWVDHTGCVVLSHLVATAKPDTSESSSKGQSRPWESLVPSPIFFQTETNDGVATTQWPLRRHLFRKATRTASVIWDVLGFLKKDFSFFCNPFCFMFIERTIFSVSGIHLWIYVSIDLS